VKHVEAQTHRAIDDHNFLGVLAHLDIQRDDERYSLCLWCSASKPIFDLPSPMKHIKRINAASWPLPSRRLVLDPGPALGREAAVVANSITSSPRDSNAGGSVSPSDPIKHVQKSTDVEASTVATHSIPSIQTEPPPLQEERRLFDSLWLQLALGFLKPQLTDVL